MIKIEAFCSDYYLITDETKIKLLSDDTGFNFSFYITSNFGYFLQNECDLIYEQIKDINDCGHKYGEIFNRQEPGKLSKFCSLKDFKDLLIAKGEVNNIVRWKEE